MDTGCIVCLYAYWVYSVCIVCLYGYWVYSVCIVCLYGYWVYSVDRIWHLLWHVVCVMQRDSVILRSAFRAPTVAPADWLCYGGVGRLYFGRVLEQEIMPTLDRTQQLVCVCVCVSARSAAHTLEDRDERVCVFVCVCVCVCSSWIPVSHPLASPPCGSLKIG